MPHVGLLGLVVEGVGVVVVGVVVVVVVVVVVEVMVVVVWEWVGLLPLPHHCCYSFLTPVFWMTWFFFL